MLSYLLYLNKPFYNAPSSPTHDMQFKFTIYAAHIQIHIRIHIDPPMYTLLSSTKPRPQWVFNFITASVISSGGLRAWD